ncbi:S9 family peptidase [Periweissella cryptocerci]|uniref:S9 family peptidase n=1 Tax=Periweissella cryptocerci TaxID=2506420 RepID=A0A4P6YV02_9LACO|nr:S9 family peptidase [Periweissella cryptocerci]QBO36566.1 S9 family peptidase [Periweissella cryptocerci]
MSQNVTLQDLYQLKTIGNPVVVGESTYLVQTHVRAIENDYQNGVYHLFEDGTTKLVANNATAPTNAFGQLAYLQKIDGQSQIIFGGYPVTQTQYGVVNFIASPTSPIITYAEKITHTAPVAKHTNRPQIRRITNQYYKADGYGFTDEGTLFEIHQFDVIQGTDKIVLTQETRTDLLDASADGQSFIWLEGADLAGDLDENTLWYLNLTASQPVKVTATLPSGTTADAVISPDGQQILLAAHDDQYPNARIHAIYLYDIATATLAPYFTEDVDTVRDAMSDLPSAGSAHSLAWLDSKTFVFQATYHGHSRLYYGNVTGDYHLIDDSARSILGFSVTDTDLLLVESKTDKPARLVSHSLVNNTEVSRYNPNADYELTHTYATAAKYIFQSEDGSDVDGWFMPAAKQGGKKAPLILYVHGGPHGAYSEAFFWEFQVWTSLGYNVAFTNPHGSTSYGQSFVNAVIGAYGEQDYRDVLAGLDAVLANNLHEIDPTQVYLAGGSYGGFMATWAAGHTDRFTAIVAQRAVINWISMFGTSDIGASFTKAELGIGLFDTDGLAKLWQFSPLAYAQNVKTPILLMHGEYDMRVPIGQAEEYYSAVKEHTDTPIEFVRFPEAWHGVSRNGQPNLREARINVMNDWFKRFSN